MEERELYSYLEGCPNVIECHYISGDYTMMVEVLFKTTMELDRFVGSIQKYGRTKTIITFSTPIEHRGIELDL